jgi:hypothetical protein
MKFIVHESPALRGDSNYIARIDLTPFGFAGLFEQVWLHRKVGGTCEMCCIPFRAYGVALKDKVRTSPDGSLVVEVVERSGRRVLRALLISDQDSAQMHEVAERISFLVNSIGLLYEWSGDRHIAVDVPPGAEIGELLDVFMEEECNGRLRWEWADVAPFTQ